MDTQQPDKAHEDAAKNGSQSISEAYLARKTHRKSRLGCVECKKRRVKCDEAKPACTNCRRRSTPCDYNTATSTRYRTPTRPDDYSTNTYYGIGSDPVTFTEKSSSYGGTPALAAAPSPHVPYYPPVAFAFDIFDMELWHHWLTVACYSFADDDLGVVMWRNNISRYAFAHEYVAQLLLALSALHLGRTYSDRASNCIRRSASLQSAAVNGMMSALADPNRSATALWIAAMMLAFCSFGRGPQPGQYLVYSDDYEPEWLGLLQGVKSIREYPSGTLDSVLPALEAGVTKQAVSPEELVPGVEKAIQKLRNSIDALRAEDTTCDKYIRPLDDLRTCFSELFEKHSNSSEVKLASQNIFVWLYRLDGDYIASIQSKRPMALVILAHYLVLMSQNKQAWYLHGWVAHIMEAIRQQLHPAYLQWLEWPISALRDTSES
ncbi:hypothetical protein DOTSEDRAFT_172825 [Dothistroma septosporum NZE10]|uniref:Zn(2)-C6 fungal-type domain-containing protein n=1 Tax=Dothistroma septosporum (strain NZE10 / CBS 128990) TaxID=675120 RepID=N1PQ52_DOTSN|nr:hypothetical protein DOTSEDRAFT_172825 [Dothistroma septosporum NZE10]